MTNVSKNVTGTTMPVQFDMDTISMAIINAISPGSLEDNLRTRDYQVIVVEKVLETAKDCGIGLCTNDGFIYGYNGNYWQYLERNKLKLFLGEVALKLGVPERLGKHYLFRDNLLKQFDSMAYLPKPEIEASDVRINLLNGTFVFKSGVTHLMPHKAEDFMTYILPFKYNRYAEAPMFQTFLDRVLPDKKVQHVVAEFMASIFVRKDVLKLEKALLNVGGGSNGKSVLFEVITALLGGHENVSNFSLRELTDNNGYYRAMIANKLLNFCPEVSGRMNTTLFKQISSGEPIGARLPYGEPLTINNYAKIAFNANQLPKDVEHTHGFYRRFLIVPFEQTIAAHEQDKELATKIINSELSGVFNWILSGLERLLSQGGFTESKEVNKAVEEFRKESDSVQMFCEELGYQTDDDLLLPTTMIYREYRDYCFECGYKAGSIKTFSQRLKFLGFESVRKNNGMHVKCRQTK